MPNNSKIKSFKIEGFKPKHLKHAQKVLEKHFTAIETHAELMEKYKKNIFKEEGLWHKIKHVLHLD